MPKVPVDYTKCKIYRIVCNDLSVPYTYVGHTTDMIRRRASHKKRCTYSSQEGHNCKVYREIRANGGFQNWIMLLVEDFPCENKDQAQRRERYWCEQLQADLNSNVPSRSVAEWRRDNREDTLEKQRLYSSIRIQCVCGVEHRQGARWKHLKTKKHRNFISSLSIQTTDAEATTDNETDSTL